MTLSGLERKNQKVAYQQCCKIEKQENSVIEKGKKYIVSLYSKNYVNKEEGNKNKKVGLEPKLVCAKKLRHDMFNMPMNEPCHVWPLK